MHTGKSRSALVRNAAIAALFGTITFATDANAGKPWLTFDPPGGNTTVPVAITPRNMIVGQYNASTYDFRGFIRTGDGAITTFSLPDMYRTIPSAVSEGGVITGSAYGTDKAGDDFWAGFVRATDGTLTAFRYDYHKATYPTAIDHKGTIVGYATDFGGNFGFMRTRDGVLSPLLDGYSAAPQDINRYGVITGSYVNNAHISGFVRDTAAVVTAFDPSGSLETHAVSINDAGAITGYYYDDNLVYHGYVRAPDGTITNFDVPGAGLTDQGMGTFPKKIDNNGNIVGCMWDSSFAMHGFLRDASGNMHVIDAPGAANTCITAIGPTGKLVGQSDTHGFRAYRNVWQRQ